MTILIDNFSMEVEEWLLVSDLVAFSADVVDLTYPISVSGTYFLHDGVEVFTIYSPISNGYTISYAPTSVVSSGTITITVHAENNNSEVVEQDYYLLYGYHVEYDDLVDWGPKSTVVTSVKVNNLAFCPNTVGEAAYFETRDLESYDLGASIFGIESVDLGATVRTQSTAFYYGQTYRITVSGVKDFSGNEMPVYEFEFMIEYPNY